MSTRAVGGIFLAGAMLVLTAVACQAAPAGPDDPSPAPTPHVDPRDDPTPTETPTDPEMVEAPAPIEEVEVVWDATRSRHIVRIVSGLPNGCVEFGEYVTSRQGGTVSIEVVNLVPADPVACTMVYGYHEGEVTLDALEPGRMYTVVVNREVTNAFTARDPEGEAMDVAESPIERSEIAETESGYVLRVTSTLPRGSSCSWFNGYDISRGPQATFRIRLTHLEVARHDIPCTEDLPLVETEVPLGADLVPGQSYTIVLNGETTNSFTARDPEGREMDLVQSPIDSVEVLMMESFPVQYRLRVVSRLPRGSSCSQFNGYDVVRASYQVHVTVTHFEVADLYAPCTSDLPIIETNIPLGTGFESGQEYTVTVNDRVTETFTAQ